MSNVYHFLLLNRKSFSNIHNKINMINIVLNYYIILYDLPIGVEWFLYKLQAHGPSVLSIMSSLILHCCIQLLDEPHSKTKQKPYKYTLQNTIGYNILMKP